MIFLTVGSALPFDRLVEMVDAAAVAGLLDCPVLAQIGNGRYVPRALESVPFLGREEYVARFNAASAVISHAGIGTIGLAIRLRKPLLVLPRSPDLGELVDDHQVKTARTFQDLGHLLMFTDATGLRRCLADVGNFEPAPRNANSRGVAQAVASHLSGLLSSGPSPGHSANESG
jgi:UDP-N-acetylglucosamine transferase subunit ALG13